MVRNLAVPLSDDDRALLSRVAQADRRDPRNQASILLADAIRRAADRLDRRAAREAHQGGGG
jgi:hypothetical protein